MCCPCLITFTNEFLVVVVFSCQVLSNFLQPYWLQHTRLPCPLLSTRVSSNTYPLSQWCYLTVSSSEAPFSFCLQSFPTSGSFPMNRVFISGGLSIGASASASALPMNTQGWFPLGLTDWISLQPKEHVNIHTHCRWNSPSQSNEILFSCNISSPTSQHL